MAGGPVAYTGPGILTSRPLLAPKFPKLGLSQADEGPVGKTHSFKDGQTHGEDSLLVIEGHLPKARGHDSLAKVSDCSDTLRTREKPTVAPHSCNLNTQGVKAGRSKVQGYHWLHSELEAGPCCVRPCQKKSKPKIKNQS